MRVEMQLVEGGGCRIRIEGRPSSVVQIQLEIQVSDDGGDLARQKGHVLVVAHALQLLALQVVQVLVEPLHAAVFLQELGGRLGADAGHAGNVVGRVAHKPQVIGNLRRRDAVFVVDALGVEDDDVGDALLGVHHVGFVGYQLADVFVARNQQGFVAGRLVASRHRAQNVVALPAGNLHHRNAHGV